MNLDYSNVQEIRSNLVNDSIASSAFKAPGNIESQFVKNIYINITDEVIEQALKDELENSDLITELEKSCSLAETILYGLLDDDETTVIEWHHHNKLNKVPNIGSISLPLFNKDLIEIASREYLNQKYRTEYIDSLLVELLIAAEYFSYIDQMLNTKGFSYEDYSPFAIKNPIKNCLMNMGTAFSYLIVLYGCLFFIPINDAIKFSIGVITAILWIIYFGLNLFFLPNIWNNYKKSKEIVINAAQQMANCYSELGSYVMRTSTISPRHLYNMCEYARTQHVVWPQELYLLLDDIISRNGVLKSTRSPFYSCEHGNVTE